MSSARIVVIAVDNSPQADEAFNYYRDFMHRPENEVIMLHCPELSNVNMRLMKGERPPYDEYERIMAEEQNKWKNIQTKFEQALKTANMNGKFEVAPSHKPGEAIVTAAKEKSATMIVTGTRGLGSLRRTVMGSVSDYVIHHAHCPVIVHRSKK